MTIRLDADIRPAESLPPYCSSCRQQEPTKRYIDFDAPCDRGYVDEAAKIYGGEGATPVPLDWLILCEDCLRVASEQVGMVTEAKAEELKRENRELEHQAETAKRFREKAEHYASTLEDAFDTRPQKIEIDHRKKPRQREAV